MSRTNTTALNRAKTAQGKAEKAAKTLAEAQERHEKAVHEHGELRSKAGKLGTKVTAQDLALSGGAVELAEAQVQAYGEAWNEAAAELAALADDAVAEGVRAELPKQSEAIAAVLERLARTLRDGLAELGALTNNYNDAFHRCFAQVKEPGTVGRNRRARLAMVERGLDILVDSTYTNLIVDSDTYRQISGFTLESIGAAMSELPDGDEGDELEPVTPSEPHPIIPGGGERRIDHAG